MLDKLFTRTDGHGRKFICKVRSPDKQWLIEIFGSNQYNPCTLHGRATSSDGWKQRFSCGPIVTADRIKFQWDLPNDSWGVFINDECYAIYTERLALRMHPRRIYSRRPPHQQAFSDYDIRFICAKKRYQKKGTHGGIIEE